MKNWYKCDMCGCYMDPGEGLLCEDCREDMRRRMKKKERYNNLAVGDCGQMEMRLEDMAWQHYMS